VGSVFNDKQGRSYVIAVDDGGDEPEPVCPDTPPGDEDPNDENGTTPDTKTPVAAPTDLGSSTTTGLVSLFAIAASLLGAAAFILRGARN